MLNVKIVPTHGGKDGNFVFWISILTPSNQRPKVSDPIKAQFQLLNERF